MTDPGGFDDLFALAQSCCAAFVEELSRYGLRPSPSLELRRSRDLLSFYDPRDGCIYISFPDPAESTAKLQMLMLRTALGARDNSELMAFLRIFVPYMVGHELGHHLRHEYGLTGQDAWHEEQVANHLALALTKHRLTPTERAFAREFLARAMDRQGDDAGRAIASYASILHSLNAAGHIDAAVVRNAERMQALTRAQAGALLHASGELSASASETMAQRPSVIASINDEYTKNMMAYMATQIGWLWLALNSAETHYVDEFAREHLRRDAELLPSIGDAPAAGEEALRALFKAALDTRGPSAAAGRYFYKRYRGSLIARLCSETDAGSSRAGLSRDASRVLEDWTEADDDPLDYLVEMAAPDVRALFPNTIGGSIDSRRPAVAHLPTDTDRRLWRQACLGDDDPAARETLARLDLLNRMDVFQALPAEVWLDVVHSLCRVTLSAGETLIWEGEQNDDVYTLSEGALDVRVRHGDTDLLVGTIARGEVFGEVAFFTGERRTATVRASAPSECFALRNADLHVLAFRHPSILMRMARVLAWRVSALNRRLIS